MPFVGAAGQLLGKLLAGIGLAPRRRLDRERAQVPAAGQPRPAARGDRGLREPPLPPDRADPAEGRRDARQLRHEAPLRQARRHHTVHGREQEVDLGGTRVLLFPIFHPAAALYTPRMLDVLEDRLRRLPGACSAGEPRRASGRRAGRRAPSPRPSRPRSSCGPSARPVLSGSGRRDSPIVSGWCVTTGSARATRRRSARRACRGCFSPATSSRVAGELGAGKTTFVRGACRALGVPAGFEPDLHDRAPLRGAVPVAHLDLYRLAGDRDEHWGDLEPYFDGTIAFVEWPEHGGAWLPAATRRHDHSGITSTHAPHDHDRQ